MRPKRLLRKETAAIPNRPRAAGSPNRGRRKHPVTVGGKSGCIGKKKEQPAGLTSAERSQRSAQASLGTRRDREGDNPVQHARPSQCPDPYTVAPPRVAGIKNNTSDQQDRSDGSDGPWGRVEGGPPARRASKKAAGGGREEPGKRNRLGRPDTDRPRRRPGRRGENAGKCRRLCGGRKSTES